MARRCAGPYDGLFLSNYATLKLARRAQPGGGRRRRDGPRRRGVRHARLARPGQAGRPAADHAGRDRGPAAAERAGRGRAGRPAAEPVRASAFQFTVTTLGRLQRPEAVRGDRAQVRRGGQIVYLRDVADVELGGPDLRLVRRRAAASTSANILIYQLPGSNALDVAKGVRGGDGADQADAPAGHGVQHPVRHDQVRRRRDQRGVPDAGRGRRCWC